MKKLFVCPVCGKQVVVYVYKYRRRISCGAPSCSAIAMSNAVRNKGKTDGMIPGLVPDQRRPRVSFGSVRPTLVQGDKGNYRESSMLSAVENEVKN